jgi:hypothetical protein
VTCDIDSEAELKEIYELLSNHYVEDDDNMFRFDYSRQFLRWALQVGGCVGGSRGGWVDGCCRWCAGRSWGD